MMPQNHILRKYTGGYTLHKSQKYQPPNVHERHPTDCQKRIIGNPNKGIEDLQWRYKDGILLRKMWHDKIGKRQMMEGIERPNQE